jgi:hypothetical protein
LNCNITKRLQCNLLVMLQFNCLITDLAIGFAFNADDEVA